MSVNTYIHVQPYMDVYVWYKYTHVLVTTHMDTHTCFQVLASWTYFVHTYMFSSFGELNIFFVQLCDKQIILHSSYQRLHVCMYVYVCMSICIHVCVCRKDLWWKEAHLHRSYQRLHACMYVCMPICMYTHVYMHTYICSEDLWWKEDHLAQKLSAPACICMYHTYVNMYV
jgi:hypothetical protein